MMEVRNKTQDDFDLERVLDMLDTAMTSKDERVQSAFRALLTIVTLTKPQEDGRYAVETSHGPLRQMQEDLKDLNRRLWSLQEEVRQMNQRGGGSNNPWAYPSIPGGPYTISSAGYYHSPQGEKEDK